MQIEAPASARYSPFETIKTPQGKIDHFFGPYSETREHLDDWFPKLLSNLGVAEGLTVELGSGHGQSAEYFLSYVAVYGQCILSEPDERGFARCLGKYRQDSRVEVKNKSALETLAELEDGSVERILYLNAIHLDEDKDKVVELAHKKLSPGGLFIANSSFIYEAVPSSEGRLYPRWMAKAYSVLERLSPELYLFLRENKDKLKHMHRTPKADYDALFTTKGFSLLDLAQYGLAFEQPGSQLRNSFVGLFRIAQYSVWIYGTMPFVIEGEEVSDEEIERRLDILTRAQQEALLEVYPQVIGARISPRNNAIWVARKPIRDEVILVPPFKG